MSASAQSKPKLALHHHDSLKTPTKPISSRSPSTFTAELLAVSGSLRSWCRVGGETGSVTCAAGNWIRVFSYKRHCRLEVLLAPLRAGATHVVPLWPVGVCRIGQRCPPSAHPRSNGRGDKRSQLDLHEVGLHLQASFGVTDGRGVEGTPAPSCVVKLTGCGLGGPYV